MYVYIHTCALNVKSYSFILLYRGLEPVINYVHSKGFKFGLVSNRQIYKNNKATGCFSSIQMEESTLVAQEGDPTRFLEAMVKQ